MNEEDRISIEISLLSRQKNGPFIKDIITDDKKWVFYDKVQYKRGDISTLNGSSLKLVDKFTYLGSSVSSTETDINTRLAKVWTAIKINYTSIAVDIEHSNWTFLFNGFLPQIQWPGRHGFNPRSSYTKDSKNGT